MIFYRHGPRKPVRIIITLTDYGITSLTTLKNRQHSILERRFCTFAHSCLTLMVRCRFSGGLRGLVKTQMTFPCCTSKSCLEYRISLFLHSLESFFCFCQVQSWKESDIYCFDITAAPSSTAETIKITESNLVRT